MKPRGVVARGAWIGVVLCVLIPSVSRAQVLSNAGTVNLNATMAQALSLSITSGSTVNFTLVNGGTADGNVPVVVQTSWNLNPLVVGTVTLYGYFSTPTQALGDGTGNYITSAAVRGRMTTGTPVTYLPFTQTNVVGPAAGSLLLYSEVVTALNAVKTRTDNLDLRIDLTALTIPAGTYTGVLTVQARSI
jgi:hypothetical protein